LVSLLDPDDNERFLLTFGALTVELWLREI